MSVFAALFMILGLGLRPPAPTLSPKAPPPPGQALDPPRPGHGGEDLEPVIQGVMEKELCLSFAHRLKAELERRGISARLLRDKDVTLPLDQRVPKAGMG